MKNSTGSRILLISTFAFFYHSYIVHGSNDIVDEDSNGKSLKGRLIDTLIRLSPLIRKISQKVLRIKPETDFPSCDGCFCIPEENQACPTNRMPRTDYTDLIPILQAFALINPYTLDCDPYLNPECNTKPPLPSTGVGTCVAEIISSVEDSPSYQCPNGWMYKLTTYPNITSSMYVTHAGPCGTCSSFQDLAVYMYYGPNLEEEATTCAYKGLESPASGISCYEDLGFTKSCATTWYYTSRNTARECIQLCTKFNLLGLPSNGEPPNCSLAPCLECDETKSGPIFLKFAGRTRRNSGLLSNILRSCSEIAKSVNQTSPCP